MGDFASALHARLTADAAVSGVIGTRAYWNKVPQSADLPYVRLQTISDPRPEHLKDYHSSRTTRIQVDCFAANYGTARGLAEKIIQAVANPATVGNVKFGRIKAEGPRDLGEDTPSGFIHRASADLLVEHANV